MSARTLKIETHGEYREGVKAAAIRLKGQWLRAAGFEPGSNVTVLQVSPGVLEIRIDTVPQLTSEDFRTAIGLFERVGL